MHWSFKNPPLDPPLKFFLWPPSIVELTIFVIAREKKETVVFINQVESINSLVWILTRNFTINAIRFRVYSGNDLYEESVRLIYVHICLITQSHLGIIIVVMFFITWLHITKGGNLES